MILPTKQISQDKSLLGIGGTILSMLERPMPLSKLWDRIRSSTSINSFEYFILSLDLLYLLNAISFKGGKVYMEKNNDI